MEGSQGRHVFRKVVTQGPAAAGFSRDDDTENQAGIRGRVLREAGKGEEAGIADREGYLQEEKALVRGLS